MSCCYSWVYLLLLSYSHCEFLLFLSVFAPPLTLSLWVSVIPECICASAHTLTTSCCYSGVISLLLSYSAFALLLFHTQFAPPLTLRVAIIPECICSSSHTLIVSSCYSWVCLLILSYSSFECCHSRLGLRLHSNPHFVLLLFLSEFAPPLLLLFPNTLSQIRSR